MVTLTQFDVCRADNVSGSGIDRFLFSTQESLLKEAYGHCAGK